MTKNLADELERTARHALSGLHPTPQGEEAGGLPFRKLLAAAFRARYLVFGTTLFGILIGSFLAITTANSYVSTGKFLFTASGAESTRVDPSRSTETSQETIGTAASYILSTDGLLRRVVDKLTPARILAPYKPGNTGDSAFKAFFFMVQRDWNATKEEDRTPEEALRRLRKAIFVERPRYTDVLVATCNANDQKLAQEILATYMKEAIQWHIEKYDDKKAYEDAGKAAADAVIARDMARAAEREFLDRKAGVAQFDEEKKRLQLAEIADSTRVSQINNDLSIKQDLVKEYDKQLEGENALKPTRIVKKKLDTTSETLASLGKARGDLERELGRLQGVFQPGNTEITRVEQEIKNILAAMTRLREEAKDAPLIDQVEDNPDYLNLVRERDKLKFEIVGLVAGKKLAADIHRETTTKLKALLDLEVEYAKLHAAVVQAMDNVAATASNWNEAQKKRALGLGNFSSLKEIEEASYPLEKEGPNRSKLLIGGLLVGLFLGLGIVVLRALPDTIVRTRNDLEQIEGVAVIGLMPRLDGRNLKRHSHLRGQGW